MQKPFSASRLYKNRWFKWWNFRLSGGETGRRDLGEGLPKLSGTWFVRGPTVRPLGRMPPFVQPYCP